MKSFLRLIFCSLLAVFFTSTAVGASDFLVSSVSPSDQAAFVLDRVKIVLNVSELGGSPVVGREVALISSSDEGAVFPDTVRTDDFGNASFEVIGVNNGVVTYTPYDLDAQRILDSRARVVFFDDPKFVLDTPDTLAYSAGAGSGAVDHFEFEEVSDPIVVGVPVSFSLRAVDEFDETVLNYDGEVRFSITGSNGNFANLPNDYEYESFDLGEHEFALATSFTMPGTYLLEARDLDDEEILGAHVFNVVNSTGNNSTGSLGSSLQLLSPLTGTYSSNVHVFSGTATPGIQLKIFDNGVAVAQILADEFGRFSYTSSVMPDGQHSLYVAEVDEFGNVLKESSVVTLNIDTVAPAVSQIVVDPSGSLQPSQTVNVKLYVDEPLYEASVLFEDNLYSMTNVSGQYYQASFVAPGAFGEYPLSFVLVDDLGNESKVEGMATVKVGSFAEQVVVADVKDLVATANEGRVTLNWSAPASFHEIERYRVYYGLSANALTEVVDTFSNASTWYIPKLANGMEYYFAVVAIDVEGNISEHFSNIVTAVPQGLVEVVEIDPAVLEGSAGNEVLQEMESEVSETGPALNALLFFSAFGGYLWVNRRKFFRKFC